MSTGKLPRAMRIGSIQAENEVTSTFVFEESLPAEPGQFVMLWLPDIDEKPFSLMDADPLTLTVARVGRFTEAVHVLKSGDHMWLRGPIGRGFDIGDGPALLAGGGYGSAPLHFLARRLRASGQSVYVALGARTAGGLILRDRFEDMGCEVHVATEDGSEGIRGLVTDLIADLLERRRFGNLYGCGPDAMLQAVESMALSRGVPAQLSWEAHMMCGMGVCGSCAHDDRLVCRDGPVFRAGSARDHSPGK